jgi:hypothetical protein
MALSTGQACSGGHAPAASATPTTRATVAPHPASPAVHAIAAQPSPEAPVPKPETREQRLIARMLERVSRARGLKPKNPVPGLMLERSALIARVKAHVDLEVPHEAISHEGLVQQLLGFIPTRFDYEGATYALLEAQLAGFYEPGDGTMYMAADLDDENAYATLAHELVHALQDQYWDLGPHSKYVAGEDDRSDAFSALAEGDATSAMADVLIGQARPGATALDMPDELFVDQVIGGMSGEATAKAPHVMRMSLVAPYIDGTLFIHALRRKGGWAAVNRAWGHPPETTEQVLHVEKWEKHEPALAVEAPEYSSLGPGWTDAETDTYGELGVRIALGEWLGAGRASALAAGWGGDRAILVRKGDAYAYAWRVRYDDASPNAPDAYAARAFAELAPAIEKLAHGHGAPTKPPGAGACIERAELGPLLVARRGRDLIVLAGPATTSPKAWAAAAHCVQARKWAFEMMTPGPHSP